MVPIIRAKGTRYLLCEHWCNGGEGGHSQAFTLMLLFRFALALLRDKFRFSLSDAPLKFLLF